MLAHPERLNFLNTEGVQFHYSSHFLKLIEHVKLGMEKNTELQAELIQLFTDILTSDYVTTLPVLSKTGPSIEKSINDHESAVVKQSRISECQSLANMYSTWKVKVSPLRGTKNRSKSSATKCIL